MCGGYKRGRRRVTKRFLLFTLAPCYHSPAVWHITPPLKQNRPSREGRCEAKSNYLILLNALMHLVHRVFCTNRPRSNTETFWRFGRNRRGVWRFEWETFRPTTGALSQFIHLAIVHVPLLLELSKRIAEIIRPILINYFFPSVDQTTGGILP
jgi:hypothetical protein